jgi:hypothetical protein
MTACKLSLCYHIEGKIVPIPLCCRLSPATSSRLSLTIICIRAS